MRTSKVMKPRRSALSFAIGLVTAATVAPGALAQPQGTQAGIEEVLVTASRREESLKDVAMAVSVIDPSQFTEAGLTRLSDVLTFVPGVSVTDNGNPFFNSVFLRGVNAVLAAGVATYVDEIPFGSSTVYTTPAPLDGTLLDLRTMDVLKGPQGTLWGASAMGGILKYNTRQPSTEEWGGNLTADLSNTRRGGLNQLYRASANGPIVSDKLAVSVTGFWQDKTGYIDNVPLGISGWDDYEYYGASGSIRWTPTEALDITLQGLYQNSQQNGTGQIQANHATDALRPGVGAGEPWFGKYQTGQADINPTEFEAQLFGLTINYDLGFATFTSVSSTQELTYTAATDVTVPFASFADLFFPATAPHTSAVLVGALGFEKVTQEFRLTSESNQQFEWIIGGFYSKEEGFNSQDLVITPAAPLYFADFPSEYEEKSVFGNATYYLSPQWDVSVGLRYTDYSNDVELAAVGPLLAPLPLNKISDDVTSYLFNLRYRPNDNLSIYARAASGFRPGGANFVLTDPATGTALNNPLFEADSLWSYELGAKGNSEDGRFGYDVAVYYIDWQDYQISFNRGGLTVVGNAEKAVSRGAEAALTFAPTEALTLRTALSYTRAETAQDAPDLGSPNGSQLPNTPKFQASADAEYRFALAGLPAYTGVSWRYKGSMPVGFPGYTEADGTFRVATAPRVKLDSFHMVDLRAGLSAGPVDVSLYVTNLFDKWAFTHFVPSFNAASLATPTRPRTLGASIRWNFM